MLFVYLAPRFPSTEEHIECVSAVPRREEALPVIGFLKWIIDLTEMIWIFGANRANQPVSQRCTNASKMCTLEKKHWRKEFITHRQSLVCSLSAAYLITSAFNQLSNWGVRSYLHWLSLLSPSPGAPCLHSRSHTHTTSAKCFLQVCVCARALEGNAWARASCWRGRSEIPSFRR